jgi:hypothetical protein
VADVEEKFVAPDEETKQSLQEEKLINAKLCLTSTRSYADQLKITFSPFEN